MKYKGGYDRQSVQSAAGKLSCNKTALKRCTIIYLCAKWQKKLMFYYTTTKSVFSV